MKKTYVSEIELISAIDEAQKYAKDLDRIAEAIDDQADAIRASGKALWQIEQLRVDAKRIRAKVSRLRSIKLVELKEALAAIRTLPLPGFETINEHVTLGKV